MYEAGSSVAATIPQQTLGLGISFLTAAILFVLHLGAQAEILLAGDATPSTGAWATFVAGQSSMLFHNFSRSVSVNVWATVAWIDTE